MSVSTLLQANIIINPKSQFQPNSTNLTGNQFLPLKLIVVSILALLLFVIAAFQKASKKPSKINPMFKEESIKLNL